MNKVFLIIIDLILINILTFSQNIIKLNPNFYNSWVEESYYTEIINCKTPVELKFDGNIKQIHFLKESNRVAYLTLREGIKREYKITKSDTIHLAGMGNNKVVLYLTNEKKLALKEKNKIAYFVALDKKYYKRSGADCLINDMFLAGNYIVESAPSKKVTFTLAGNISGIENFNRYSIPINLVQSPSEFDIVLLEEIDKKVKNTKMLHWKKKKNKLVLYNIQDCIGRNGKYSTPQILDKYLILLRIE